MDKQSCNAKCDANYHCLNHNCLTSYLKCSLADAITNIAQDEDFTDISIEVEGQIYRSYKFVLCAYSGYFRGLISSGMKESIESKVTLKDISSRTFRVILDLIFKCHNGVDCDNVIDIFHAANRLQMLPLLNICKDVVRNENFIDKDNCFQVYRNMILLDEDIAEKAWNFILDNFEELRSTKSIELQTLTRDVIKQIISSPKLHTTSEDDVVAMLIDWTSSETDFSALKYNNASFVEIYPRSKYLCALLENCRLLLITESCLQSLLENNVFIQQLPEAKYLLEKCLLLKQEKHNGEYNASSKLSIHRDCDTIENVIISFSPSDIKEDEDGITPGHLWRLSSKPSSHFGSTYKPCDPVSFCGFEGKVIASTIFQNRIFMIIISNTFVLYSASLLEKTKEYISPQRFERVMIKNELKYERERQIWDSFTPCMISLPNGLCIITSSDRQHSPLESYFKITTPLCILFAVTPGPKMFPIHLLYLPESEVCFQAVSISSAIISGSTKCVVVFASRNSKCKCFKNRSTDLYCFDVENGQYHHFETIQLNPENLCVFQSVDETFFLFDNGSLYCLIKSSNGSVVNLKSSFIAQLWGKRNGFVRSLKSDINLVRECHLMGLRYALIIDKVLYIFGTHKSELIDEQCSYEAINDLLYINYLCDFDMGIFPDGYLEYLCKEDIDNVTLPLCKDGFSNFCVETDTSSYTCNFDLSKLLFLPYHPVVTTKSFHTVKYICSGENIYLPTVMCVPKSCKKNPLAKHAIRWDPYHTITSMKWLNK